MKDRFALAILASIALHLLLLEVVTALEFLWPAARQSSERHVIPVSLIEMDRPPNPLVRAESGDGRRPLAQARSAGQAPLAPVKPAVHVSKERASPPKAAAAPAEVATCSEPTDRPLPEAMDRREQKEKESPAANVATLSADRLHPAGLMPPQDSGRCETATGPGDAVAGVGSAGGGSSRGDAAGGGGEGDGNAGAGAVLVPGEFLAGNPPPRYPLIARRKGWEGTVVIDIQVSGDGRVRAARIEKSSSYTVLDDAALGAVRNWRIAPSGCSDGTDHKFRVPVVFRLTQM